MLLRKIIVAFTCVILSVNVNAQYKPGISDTCDMLKLWDGEKIYCHVKNMDSVWVRYIPCTDSDKDLTLIDRHRVHLWYNTNNGYVVVSHDSISDKSLMIKADTTYVNPIPPSDKGPSIKHKLFISGGIAYSTIGTRVYGIDFTGGGVASLSPAYNASIDYGLTQSLSIGFAGTYQELTGVPIFLYNQGSDDALEYITRFNTGVRILEYLVHKEKYQFYMGGRLGISYWRDMQENPLYYQITTLRSTTLTDKTLSPSIQYVIGLRLIGNIVAFQIEFGIGAPYFAEAGLSFKI